METVLMLVVVLGVVIYYGFMRSVEVLAKIANNEVTYLSDSHSVSVIERTANLDSRISEDTAAKAAGVKAKIKAMNDMV